MPGSHTSPSPNPRLQAQTHRDRPASVTSSHGANPSLALRLAQVAVDPISIQSGHSHPPRLVLYCHRCASCCVTSRPGPGWHRCPLCGKLYTCIQYWTGMWNTELGCVGLCNRSTQSCGIPGLLYTVCRPQFCIPSIHGRAAGVGASVNRREPSSHDVVAELTVPPSRGSSNRNVRTGCS